MDTVNYITIFLGIPFLLFACAAVSIDLQLGTLVVCCTLTGTVAPLVHSPAACVCLCTGHCITPCWMVGPILLTSTVVCGETW